jgi:quercetin dioxygenase-like cupin family protein
MFKRTAFFVVTAALALDAYSQQPAPTAPPPVKRTIIQRTDIPGTNLEVISANVEIAAGFKAGRHNHPGVVVGFVADGDFWIQVDGQPEQFLKVGESVTLPDRVIHNEGAGAKPAKLYVIYVLEKGKPLATPAQ